MIRALFSLLVAIVRLLVPHKSKYRQVRRYLYGYMPKSNGPSRKGKKG